MLHDAGCHLSGNKNNCFVTMPMKGVYKLQKRNLQTNQTMMLNSQWSAQYNVWLLSPAKQAHYKFQKQGFQKRFEIWIQCRVELCWNLSSIALQKHKCYFNSLGPIADISVMRLSASWCYFRQCLMFCVSRKGGTGGGGWVHPKGANSMVASGLIFIFRSDLVGTGRLFLSFLA